MPTNAEIGLKTLNVVTHGTFFFWVKPKEIEVLIPKVKMHAYYAGNWEPGQLIWLKEGRTFALRNVPQQEGHDLPAEVDKGDNIVLPGTPSDQDHTLRRIRLPLPKEIKTLQRLTLQKSNFVGSQDHTIVPKRYLGLVHAFIYDLHEGDQPPALEGLIQRDKPYTWDPTCRIVDGTATLHLYADPPARLSMGSMALKHPTEAFSALTRLIPQERLGEAVNFQFQYPPSEIPLIAPTGALPPGIRKIELVTLAVSNLLTPAQLRQHGIGRKGQMVMDPMPGTGKYPISMTQDDVGCQTTVTCAPGWGK